MTPRKKGTREGGGGRGREGERRREKERIYNIQPRSICIVVNY
jgi:hypothetical protein